MIFQRRFSIIQGVPVAIHERDGETLYGEIVLSGGKAFDPEGKEGVSYLLSSLLYRGCSGKTYEEIIEKLDSMGSSFSVSASTEAITVSFWSLSQYADETISTIADCLFSPEFSEEELQKQIERGITELKQNWDIPEAAASMIFHRKVFEPHPYSRQETEKSLRKIRREDLVTKKNETFRKASAIAVLSGSYKEPEAALGRLISSLKEGGKKFALPAPEPRKSLEIYFYLKQDAEQTQIRLGHPSFPRKVPFYEEAIVFNYILGGGGFSSRLMERVRARGGLTYSIRSSFSPMLYGGLFSISTFTKPETTAKMIEEITDEIKKTLKEGVSEEEVEKAKGYFLGHFPLGLETPAQIGSLLSGILFYGLEEDYPEKFLKKMESLSAARINEVARDLVKPESFTIVAVGNERAEKEIKKIGKIIKIHPE